MSSVTSARARDHLGVWSSSWAISRLLAAWWTLSSARCSEMTVGAVGQGCYQGAGGAAEGLVGQLVRRSHARPVGNGWTGCRKGPE